MSDKRLLRVVPRGATHWVGDGFPVHTAFDYRNAGRELSPFLMLDHAGPAIFEPTTTERRGVGEHPHRGFETVTIVYDGEVEHRDSSGGGGLIGPGDVQWMTAASGLVHEEFHARDWAARGGRFHLVQLWVNLPAHSKMSSPGYQALLATDIPTVNLADDAGTARLIAGDGFGARGAARTFTPMQVWDLALRAGRTALLPAHTGRGVALLLLEGQVQLQGRELASGDLAVLSLDGDSMALTAEKDARILWLSGEPILEPMVGYGPFVMNTREEIVQAVSDFQAGRMGTMVAASEASIQR